MRNSNQNAFLYGGPLAVIVFFVLWFGLMYLLSISLLFWGHFFNPRWYEKLIVYGGGAGLAWATIKRIAGWIISRRKHD